MAAWDLVGRRPERDGLIVRGLVFDGPDAIRFADDLPVPTVQEPTDAIVSVELAGLCGSDLHPYLGREAARPGVIAGHEATGTVVEVGSEVERVTVGDRVIVPFTVSGGRCPACVSGLSARCESSALFGWGDPSGDSPPLHGTQAEMLRVPLADGTLVRRPHHVDDHTALLLSDNLLTAWHALARSDRVSGPLAVIGLGAVGLCAVALAAGTGPVLAIDPVATRREAAAAIDPAVRAVSPEDGPAAAAALGPIGSVVEAAGTPAAQILAAQLVSPGGTVSIISVQTTATFGISPVVAYDRNLTIRAGRAPVRSVLDRILPALESGSVRVPTGIVFPTPTAPSRTARSCIELSPAAAEGS